MSRTPVIWLLLLCGSVIPLFLLNRLLQQWIRPRESFPRLVSYMLLMMALVFAFGFAVVWLVTRIFPRG